MRSLSLAICWLGCHGCHRGVTEHFKVEHTDALLQGYRAAFWTIFAVTTLVVPITFFGLTNTGFVGKKDE